MGCSSSAARVTPASGGADGGPGGVGKPMAAFHDPAELMQQRSSVGGETKEVPTAATSARSGSARNLPTQLAQKPVFAPDAVVQAAASSTAPAAVTAAVAGTATSSAARATAAINDTGADANERARGHAAAAQAKAAVATAQASNAAATAAGGVVNGATSQAAAAAQQVSTAVASQVDAAGAKAESAVDGAAADAVDGATANAATSRPAPTSPRSAPAAAPGVRGSSGSSGDGAATGAEGADASGTGPSSRTLQEQHRVGGSFRRRATSPMPLSSPGRLRPVMSSPNLNRRGTPPRLNPLPTRSAKMSDLRGKPGSSFLKRPLPHLGHNLVEANTSLTRQEMDALLARRTAAAGPGSHLGEAGAQPAALQPDGRRRRGSNLGANLTSNTIPLERMSPDWAADPYPARDGSSPVTAAAAARANAAARVSRRKRSLLAITPPITAAGGESSASAVTRDLSSFVKRSSHSGGLVASASASSLTRSGGQVRRRSVATASASSGDDDGPLAVTASPPKPTDGNNTVTSPVPVAVAVSGGTHHHGRGFLTYERDPSLRRNEIDSMATRLTQPKRPRRRSALGRGVMNASDMEEGLEESSAVDGDGSSSGAAATAPVETAA